jgi:hypothetical protein
MKRAMFLFCGLMIAGHLFAWEQTIVNETSGTLMRENKHLSGDGCTFSQEILKKEKAAIGKNDSSGTCLATIKNSQGKKAQLKCNENGCELIQSLPIFSLEKTNGSYTIRD